MFSSFNVIYLCMSCIQEIKIVCWVFIRLSNECISKNLALMLRKICQKLISEDLCHPSYIIMTEVKTITQNETPSAPPLYPELIDVKAYRKTKI